jgi:hypothetical protein
MQDDQGNPMVSAIAGEPVEFVLSYETNIDSYQDVVFSIWIRDAFLKGMVSLSNRWTGEKFSSLPQTGEVVCRLPKFPLREGRYYLDLGANINGVKADRVIRAVPLDVVNGKFYRTGKTPTHPNDGDFLCKQLWKLRWNI